MKNIPLFYDLENMLLEHEILTNEEFQIWYNTLQTLPFPEEPKGYDKREKRTFTKWRHLTQDFVYQGYLNADGKPDGKGIGICR